MRSWDFRAAKAAAQPHLAVLVRSWLPTGRQQGAEWVARNPRRPDRHPGSFKVNLRTGRWADFATGDRGGDLISLVAWRYDIPQAEAAKRLASLLSIPFEVSR